MNSAKWWMAAVLAAGCAPAAEAGDDGEAADEARASEQFYTVRRDTRRCAYPRCGGFWLARAGRATTRCGDGVSRAECYVPELTVRGLAGADRDRVIAAASGATLSLVIRGELRAAEAVAAQAWVAPSGSAAFTGTLRLVSQSDCSGRPRCYAQMAKALSNGRTTYLNTVDFGAAPGTDAELEAAWHDAQSLPGIITAGAIVSTPDGPSHEVTQYLLPARPTPQALCGDALQRALADATRGLLMPSESDYPFEYVSRAGAGNVALTEARFRTLFGVAAGTPVEVRALDDQFRWLSTEREDMTPEEREQARRFRALLDAVRANLRDARVYRVGTISIPLYILGTTRCGDVAGLRTTVIET